MPAGLADQSSRSIRKPSRFRGKPISGNTQFCNRLYDVEIRRVICSANAIESINARYRRAIRARGHFSPNKLP